MEKKCQCLNKKKCQECNKLCLKCGNDGVNNQLLCAKKQLVDKILEKSDIDSSAQPSYKLNNLVANVLKYSNVKSIYAYVLKYDGTFVVHPVNNAVSQNIISPFSPSAWAIAIDKTIYNKITQETANLFNSALGLSGSNAITWQMVYGVLLNAVNPSYVCGQTFTYPWVDGTKYVYCKRLFIGDDVYVILA